MNVELLHEIKNEIDRIYITGIRTARNNSRILKALPALEKYRDENPAYADLLEALGKLIKPGVHHNIEILSTIHASLGYLLRLHSQAVLSDEERTEQIPVMDMNEIQTHYSFLELQPLIKALTETGKNRLAIIEDARKKNMFNDVRTYLYLNKALADTNSEVVECIENIIKNDIGNKIIPFLINHIELNDKPENIRRFSLLFDLKYKGFNTLLDKVLHGNSVKLLIKAIAYISGDVNYEDQLIGFCDHPHKSIRELAYVELLILKTEKAERKVCESLIKALKKNNKAELELIVNALSQVELCFLFDELLEQINDVFINLIITPKKVDSDAFIGLRYAVYALKNKKRAEVYDFLMEILLHSGYNEAVRRKMNVLSKPAKEVSLAIINIIGELEPEKQITLYAKIIREMTDSEWKFPFYSKYMYVYMMGGASAENIYLHFAPYYQSGHIRVGDLSMLSDEHRDNRWIDELYKTLEHIDDEEDVEVLLETLDLFEPIPSERYNRQLVAAARQTRKYILEITNMIMKRNLPDKFDVIYSLVKQFHDRKDAVGSYALRQLSRATYWNEFPKTYAVKIRELKNIPRAISTKIEE